MNRKSPTDDPGFKRTLRNLLTAPPKRQADMKVGKVKAKKAKSPKRKSPETRAKA